MKYGISRIKCCLLGCNRRFQRRSHVLGCAHSYEVWEHIHDYFHKQTRATARQLRTQLQATNLGGKSMHEFLSQIKALLDALASFGSLIMLQEHVDSILEGLPSDYHSIIAIIESLNLSRSVKSKLFFLLMKHV